jgi:hypothetical protein
MNKQKLKPVKRDKLYIIYVRGPFENDELFLSLYDYQDDEMKYDDNDEDVIMMYAYTTEKKILKKFKKTRNMNRFFVVEKDISFWSDKNFNDFVRRYSSFEITVIGLFTANYKVHENTNTGFSEVLIPITTFEEMYIDTNVEYYDEWIRDNYTEDDLYMMSLIIRAAKPEFLKIIVDSGLIEMFGFVEFIITGETNIDFSCELDEVNTLLEYFGELFEF